MSRIRASLLLIAASLTGAGPALADDTQACVSASEKAQQLRNGGKLGEAREQLAVCGRGECPKLIQQDCTQWMSEVLAILPSVVPGAKDRKGRDLIDVRVLVDGKVATEKLDGKAIVVDPGVHVFRFEARGGAAAVEEQVVARQGEKNRILTITIATGDDTPAPAPVPAPPVPPPAAEPSSTPLAAVVVGGLGLVTLGVAGYLGLSGNAEARELRDTCAPNCVKSDVDDVRTQWTVAGITAGVGGALLVTGVVLFIVHGKSSSRSGSAAPLTGVVRF
jgi:hypothetical protein